jgi:prolyl-tRNA synthetase
MGALIMTHSDDQGLVLPPTLAPEQVVIVPIWQEDNKEEVVDYAADIEDALADAGVRVHLDDRENRNPGFKYNEWELQGVPLRIEVGPNEVEEETATLVHRPDGESETVDRAGLSETVDEHLETIFAKLYASAEETLEGEIREAESREEILGTIGQHGGYVKCGWCGDEDCEEPIKDAIAAEIAMVPLDRGEKPIHEECAICGEDAEETAYFAKTY